MSLQDKPNNLSIILTLMMTIIIDIMGVGLVFPIMSHLFLGPHAFLVDPDTSTFWRTFDYGFTLAAWPIGLFFGAPYIGKLSDKYGRKPLLILCLFGVMVTYVLSGIAIMQHSMWLFVLSRLVSGYFSGSFELAQALIVDISLPENKVRNMSWITFSACTGFVIGPMLSAFTVNLDWQLSVGIATPLFIAAVISLLNIILVAILLKERFKGHLHLIVSPWAAITAFIFAFTDKRITRLTWVFFFQQSAWGLFIYTVPIYVSLHFGWEVRGQGFLFAASGLGNMVTLALIQPWIFKRFTMKSAAIFCAAVSAIMLIGFLLFATGSAMYTIMILTSMFNLLCYSAVLAFFSDAVSPEEQGLVLGGSGSAFALSQVLMALLAGVIADVGDQYAFISAAVLMLACAFGLVNYVPKKHQG